MVEFDRDYIRTDQLPRCEAFMLRDDTELWWQSTHEIISSEKGVISFADFKNTFMEEYYPEDAQLRKQQKFTQLCQRGAFHCHICQRVYDNEVLHPIVDEH